MQKLPSLMLSLASLCVIIVGVTYLGHLNERDTSTQLALERADRLSLIGDDALKANDLSLAANSYSQAVVLRPNWTEGQRTLAEIHARQILKSGTQEPERAMRLQEELYEALLIGGGNRALLLTAFGKMLMDRGFHQLARPRLEEAVAVDGKMLAPLLYLGQSHIREKTWATAEKFIGKALELEPEAAGVHYAMGQIKIGIKDWEGAAKHYAKAANSTGQGAVWGELGQIQGQREKWGEAEEAFNKAISLNPKLVELYSAYGFSLAKNGKIGPAIEVYKKAYNTTGKASDLAQIGALFMVAKKFPEALKTYLEVRKLQAYNPEPDCRIGLIYQEVKNAAGAHAAFTSCLKKSQGVKGMEPLAKLATAALEKLVPLAENLGKAKAKKTRKR